MISKRKSSSCIYRAASTISVLVLLAICLSAAADQLENCDPVYVAMINSDPVTNEELQFWMDHHRSTIHRYFYRTHGIADAVDFWDPDKQFNQESPLEMLKKLAMESLTKTRIQLQMAQMEGLIQDSRFSAIMAQRSKENDHRLATLNGNGIIYGPKEYSEPVYFDYIFSNLVIRIKQRLEENSPDTQSYDERVNHLVDLADIKILADFYTVPLSSHEKP